MLCGLEKDFGRARKSFVTNKVRWIVKIQEGREGQVPSAIEGRGHRPNYFDFGVVSIQSQTGVILA